MLLEETVIRHCAPTLAGLKTGSLFSVRYNDRAVLCGELRRLNGIFLKKGLRAVPLKFGRSKSLIYVYRPERLSEDMTDPEAQTILGEKGYPCASPERCITELARHLDQDAEFPHEIGLFLGYPPEDVRGFMQNTCRGVKCSGCWKVYGDAEAAQRTFRKYRKCTEIYCRESSRGRSLEKLTVPQPNTARRAG